MESSHHTIGLRVVAARLATCLTLSLTGASLFAQVPAPDSSATASAPQVSPRSRPVPRPSNSSDAQRSMDLDNEPAGGKVLPQVRIPLGRNAGAPVFERRRTTGAAPALSPATAASATGGSINDSAARCDSETDKNARSGCRERASRQP